MAVQNEPQYFQEARRAGNIVVSEAPKLDLESYIANYQGKQRFERLYHIAKTSTVLWREALDSASEEAKNGKDSDLYERLMTLWSQQEPENPKAQKDDEWLLKVSRENKAETARLETELKGYKNNLIKESIRMGYDDTGRHYQDIGELGEAIKSYGKEREVAQSPVHICTMLQRQISVYVEQQSWVNVASTISKLQNVMSSTPSLQKHETMYKAIVGLAHMCNGKYDSATTAFLSCSSDILQPKPEDDDNGPGVLTSSDIATYGALCALATLDRSQVQERVLDNPEFRQFLELEPHLRRTITAFLSRKFSTCLEILNSYRADYLLDMYLAPHFLALFDRIRSKAIVQYFVPFSSVSFKALAEAFGTSKDVIESSLIDLIKSGILPGRLDLENGLLVAYTTDSRSTMHENALKTAKEYESTMHQKILRMEILHAKLEIKDPRSTSRDQPFSGDVLMGMDGGSLGSQGAGRGKKLLG